MTSPLLPARRPDYEMAAPMDEERPKGSPFRVQRLFIFLLKYWWVPVLSLTVCLSAASVYMKYMPLIYLSSARMMETRKIQVAESGVQVSDELQNSFGTQTELLQSSKLRNIVLSRLSASGNYVVPVGKNGQALPVKIQLTPSAKSSIFSLDATSADGVFARKYLDVLMDVYLDYRRTLRKEVSDDALKLITEQVQSYKKDLDTQQDLLTAFEKTNNLSILQEEGTVAGGYLARLKTQLSDLESEERLLLDAEQVTNGAGQGEVDPRLEANASGSANARFEEQAASRNLALLKLDREKLSQYLLPKHPKMVKLDAEIERAEKLMDIFRNQSHSELAALRDATDRKIKDTQALIQETSKKVVEAEGRIGEAETLKMNVQRAQSVYDRLGAMGQNVRISRDIEPETLSILEPASHAKRSYSQQTVLLAGSTLGGLCLGLGIVLLVAFRDDKFRSAVEINEKYGDAIVGQVPEVLAVRGNGSVPLLALNDERHIYAESFRGLRSALFFGGTGGERLRVLLITSAVPNEGKSTIAANLARTLALGGSRVVLVDADLRRGTLHKLMALQRAPGLSELLGQPDDLEKIIQRDTLPNLDFIACGNHIGNPGDALLGPAMNQILARLRHEYDYVLIDTCPVFAADDATTLAPKVDGTLFVVRSEFSSARAVQEALEQLSQRQAKVIGLIFNRANASARTYYYSKYAEYHEPAEAD